MCAEVRLGSPSVIQPWRLLSLFSEWWAAHCIARAKGDSALLHNPRSRLPAGSLVQAINLNLLV